MQIAKYAIRNAPFIYILVVLVVLAGYLSYSTMPRSEDPSLNVPNFSIVVVYPGASVEDMEELVATPIEDKVNELDDIKEIKTKITVGLVVMRVEGFFGIDIDDKYDKITAEVNKLRPELPADIFSLEVNKFSPQDVLIAQLALVSKGSSYANMVSFAEQVEEEVEQLEGIKEAEVEAFPEEQILIEADLPKMAQQNVDLQQLVGILKGNNLNIPAGDIEMGRQSFTVKSTGNYRNTDEIGNTIIGGSEGQVIYLKDVADVRIGYEDDRWISRFNGDRSVIISVRQKSGKNILDVTEGLMNKVQHMREKSPAGMQLQVAYLQAPAVSERVSGFFTNLLQGIFFVGLIIFFFLGFRSSVIIMTVIPLAILMAIAMLDYSGFGLQQISIAGLVIALGLLVDNGIVVLENIIRYRNQGFSSVEAAIKGTEEVGVAIISATATTLLAFFPLTQLGGATGEFLQTLPLIVIFALLASLLLALVLNPVLSAKILGMGKAVKDTYLSKKIDVFIEKVYLPSLKQALKRPWLLIGVAVAGLVGAVMLFPSVGVSFFPTADKPLMLIEVEAKENSSLAQTDQAVQYVENLLASHELVSNYVANTGHGNPQVYYNRIPASYNKNIGQLVVNLHSWEGEAFYTFMRDLRLKFREYPDAKITMRELKNGPPFDAAIEIKLLGEEVEVLKKLAANVQQIIENHEGTLSTQNPFETDKTSLRVNVNKQKASMLGVPWQSVDLLTRAAVAGIEVDKTTLDNQEEYSMVVRYNKGQSVSVTDLPKLYVPSVTGAQVPLSQIATVAFERGLARLDHFNTQRAATVFSDVYNSDQTAAITQDIIAEIDQIDFPEGYSYYVGGEFATQQSSFGALGQSLALALLGIFAVLVLQFRSMLQPLIVFSAIPFALIGSILALFITGWSFSFFAFVGFTSLVGIVVNNSIIMVDFTNQLLQEGNTIKEALLEGARTRFKPIVLTSLTTILGLLPLTLNNSGLWSPLGWTIIGGMVTSTFLVLLLVPVLYKLLTKTAQ